MTPPPAPRPTSSTSSAAGDALDAQAVIDAALRHAADLTARLVVAEAQRDMLAARLAAAAPSDPA